MATTNWREHGVRIVHGDALDPNTPQTPGMTRAAAINRARAGAEKQPRHRPFGAAGGSALGGSDPSGAVTNPAPRGGASHPSERERAAGA